MLYHNDIRHYRGVSRSAIREWMHQRREFKLEKQHPLSLPEKSELYIYGRKSRASQG